MLARRQFLSKLSTTSLLALVPDFVHSQDLSAGDTWLKVSLQQYSFRSMLVGKSPELSTLDYPKFAVENFGINALEYFNGFFEDRSGDQKYFNELRQRCDDLGVENQLMLCRNKRAIDDADSSIRAAAAKDYLPWLEASHTLGCHSIRVDCRSVGDADEVLKQAVDGLHRICDLAKPYGIDIIVENHGNHSSNGKWLASLMRQANRENLGTLPDFGNFHEYDRYKGVRETLPWARVVCAKIHEFTPEGQAANTDFLKMIRIIKDSGYEGYIAIEYEGEKPSPVEGVRLAQQLIAATLEKMS